MSTSTEQDLALAALAFCQGKTDDAPMRACAAALEVQMSNVARRDLLSHIGVVACRSTTKTAAQDLHEIEEALRRFKEQYV